MNHQQAIRPLLARVAVVTGGGRDLGRELALALADKGAHVAVIGRGSEALHQTSRAIEQLGCRSLPVVADLTREEEVDEAFAQIVDRLGPVSILVNNASAPRMPRPVAEMLLAEWNLTLSTKLTAAMLCAREALSSMAPLGRGSIINISGTTGLRGTALLSAHSVAQAGLIAFSQSLAREVGMQGVRVNAVVPSAIAGDSLTQIVQGLAEVLPGQDGRGPDLTAMSPLGRIVQAHEVAAVVNFLASDDSTGITGQAIPILLD